MKNFLKNDLLPEGFKVLLPEEAEKEEFISRKILDFFFRYSYFLVKTPLVEYEDNDSQSTLLEERNNPFILMEPDTKKVLILRSDITPQVAKLASSKLIKKIRPLRLTYKGEVFRNIKNIYQTDRQFKQIGAEIIGGPNLQSFLEILDVTIKGLYELKIKNITIDFTLPAISRYLGKTVNFKKKDGLVIKEALDNKNSSLIKNKKYNYIKDIIELSGPLEKVKNNFKGKKFPKPIKLMVENFFKTVSSIKKKHPSLSLTLDITEAQSFLKYKDLAFKIYNKESAEAIAIGGNYEVNNKETGVGTTIMLNKIINSIIIKKANRIYVPFNNEITDNFLEKNKLILVRELSPRKSSIKEAKRLGCNFILDRNGKIKKIM
ncbi:MAG: hypothetical protein CMP24_01710 [Rickettsiales bacterium]|nr:hypothetical protein [Rickettsiales bacterium]|tara:strand:- start:130 stop:1257 length:1128 start_codon:yes stop_codon:yes gene_type:complete